MYLLKDPAPQIRVKSSPRLLEYRSIPLRYLGSLKCDSIHPRQLSPFPERSVLPFSNEVILSRYEELDSTGNDLFTSWAKLSEHEILVEHMVGVNTTPHTSHFLIDLHAHAWLKLCVCRAHITCHESSPCAPVFVLTLFDYSTFLSLLTIFSSFILSFLLPINIIFHDVVDKFPVHSS